MHRTRPGLTYRPQLNLSARDMGKRLLNLLRCMLYRQCKAFVFCGGRQQGVLANSLQPVNMNVEEILLGHHHTSGTSRLI